MPRGTYSCQQLCDHFLACLRIYIPHTITETRNKLRDESLRDFDISADSDDDIMSFQEGIESTSHPEYYIPLVFDFTVWVCHIADLIIVHKKFHPTWPDKLITHSICILCGAQFCGKQQPFTHFTSGQCIAPCIYQQEENDKEITYPRARTTDVLMAWSHCEISTIRM